MLFATAAPELGSGSALPLAVILGAASLGLPQHVAAAPPGALKALDTDNDGTVDLAEAEAAASKLFDKLDRDQDGTLDRRELRGRMVSKELPPMATATVRWTKTSISPL
jgi:hypothetical protein